MRDKIRNIQKKFGSVFSGVSHERPVIHDDEPPISSPRPTVEHCESGHDYGDVETADFLNITEESNFETEPSQDHGPDDGNVDDDPIPAEDAAIEDEEPVQEVVETVMSLDISKLSGIAGFIGACLVDSESGMMLGSEGGKGFDLETAGAANSEVVRAKLSAMAALGLEDMIEDILITLGTQYHMIRPLKANPSVFIYVALDRKSANLALARIEVKKVESTLSL